MTSIEALNKIERATDVTKETSRETTVSNPYFKEIQTIRKDLEVLEILKMRCVSTVIRQYEFCTAGKDEIPNIKADMRIELTENEYEKVKGWLENGE